MSRRGWAERRPGRRGLVAALVVIVGLGAAAGMLSWRAYETRRDEAGNQFLADTETTARSADRFFESRLATLAALAAMPGVRAGDLEAMAGPFEAAAGSRELGFSGGVGWIDLDGQLRYSTAAPAAALPVDLADRLYVRRALGTGDPQVSEAIISRTTGEPGVALVVPTRDGGLVTGLVVASVRLADVAAVLDQAVALDQLHIVDRTGTTIFDHGPVGSLEALAPGPVRRAVAEADAEPCLHRDDGMALAVAGAPLAGWTLVADQTLDGLYGEAVDQLVRELGWLLLLVLVAASAAVYAARRIDSAHGALVGQRNDLATLNHAAAGLARAATVAEVAEVARRSLAHAFATEVVWVALADDDGERLEVLAAPDGPDRDRLRAIPLASEGALPEAARTGTRLVLTRSSYAHRFPATAGLFRATGAPAVVFAPFASRGASGVVSVELADEAGLADHAAALLDNLLAMVAEAFARARALEREQEVSLTLQRALLPTTSATTVDRLQRALRYEPGGRDVEVGGDWYDLFELPDGRLGIVIGDVVGRGAAAAATMGQVRIALRSTAPLFDSAAAALEHLDRSIAHLPGTLMTTALFAILDPERHEVTMASAGHLPPILVGPDGARALVEVGGPALGIALAGRPRTETTVALPPEHTLVLYTDGLVERRGEPIDRGWDRLVAELAGAWDRPVEALADQILGRRLTDGHDDVALALLRIPGHPARTFSARQPATPAQLGAVRRRLREWLAAGGVGGRLDDVLLAAGEAASNVVEHAYGDGRTGLVADLVVEAEWDGDDLVVVVGDTGRWDPRPSEPHRGRGLAIMEGVTDGLTMQRTTSGTTVRLRFDHATAGQVTRP